MVADTAKAYCRQELMPRVTAANRSEIFDRAIMTEFGELGLLVRARLSMHRQAFALSILGAAGGCQLTNFGFVFWRLA